MSFLELVGAGALWFLGTYIICGLIVFSSGAIFRKHELGALIIGAKAAIAFAATSIVVGLIMLGRALA